nr:PREDICTED: uncharacterized protein LOC107078475 [Lepisosteus oculatus]
MWCVLFYCVLFGFADSLPLLNENAVTASKQQGLIHRSESHVGLGLEDPLVANTDLVQGSAEEKDETVVGLHGQDNHHHDVPFESGFGTEDSPLHGILIDSAPDMVGAGTDPVAEDAGLGLFSNVAEGEPPVEKALVKQLDVLLSDGVPDFDQLFQFKENSSSSLEQDPEKPTKLPVTTAHLPVVYLGEDSPSNVTKAPMPDFTKKQTTTTLLPESDVEYDGTVPKATTEVADPHSDRWELEDPESDHLELDLILPVQDHGPSEEDVADYYASPYGYAGFPASDLPEADPSGDAAEDLSFDSGVEDFELGFDDPGVDPRLGLGSLDFLSPTQALPSEDQELALDLADFNAVAFPPTQVPLRDFVASDLGVDDLHSDQSFRPGGGLDDPLAHLFPGFP